MRYFIDHITFIWNVYAYMNMFFLLISCIVLLNLLSQIMTMLFFV